MHRRQLFQCLVATAFVLLVIGWFVVLGKLRTTQALLADENYELERAAQSLKQLQAATKSRASIKPALDDAEVLELARLRNEVTRLRSEQRAGLPTSGPSRAKMPVITNAPPPDAIAPAIVTFTSAVSANVGLGQALAVGGWASPTPGKRIVGLISPELHADSPGAVLVTMWLIEFPDATMEQLGLHGLRTDAASSQSQAVFSAEQLKALLDRVEKISGVDVLSAPRVVTRSGTQAQISVRQARPDGTQTGPLIDITPTLDATGTAVRLDVGVELNLASPAKQP